MSLGNEDRSMRRSARSPLRSLFWMSALPERRVGPRCLWAVGRYSNCGYSLWLRYWAVSSPPWSTPSFSCRMQQLAWAAPNEPSTANKPRGVSSILIRPGIGKPFFASRRRCGHNAANVQWSLRTANISAYAKTISSETFFASRRFLVSPPILGARSSFRCISHI